MICFIAEVGYKTALFGSEQIAGAAYVEVLHGYVYAAAKVGKTLNGLQTASRYGRQRIAGRHKQIAEGLARTASHTTAQLMQCAQTEAMGIVDDNGVDVGHIDAVLDDGGGYEHIVVVIGEVDNHLLEVLGLHLAMAHHHAGVGHYAMHHILEMREAIDVIVNDKHLPVARHLEIDGFAQYIIIECIHRGEYGVAVGRRGVESAQVARAHKRKLQGARYGRSTHGERIHIYLHLL